MCHHHRIGAKGWLAGWDKRVCALKHALSRRIPSTISIFRLQAREEEGIWSQTNPYLPPEKKHPFTSPPTGSNPTITCPVLERDARALARLPSPSTIARVSGDTR